MACNDRRGGAPGSDGIREFAIGEAFSMCHALRRCTDVGTRTVAAIRLDRAGTVLVEVCNGERGPEAHAVIDLRVDASWLSGPPHPVAERVFDEYDLPACQPVAAEDVATWTPEREQDRRR